MLLFVKDKDHVNLIVFDDHRNNHLAHISRFHGDDNLGVARVDLRLFPFPVALDNDFKIFRRRGHGVRYLLIMIIDFGAAALGQDRLGNHILHDTVQVSLKLHQGG